MKDASPLETTHLQMPEDEWLMGPAGAVTQPTFIPILSLALTQPQRVPAHSAWGREASRRGGGPEHKPAEAAVRNTC